MVPDHDDDSVSWPPSADELGSKSLDPPTTWYDHFDFATIADDDPVLNDFICATGCAGMHSSPTLNYIDDNPDVGYNLDGTNYNSDDDVFNVHEASWNTNSPLLDSSLTDMELLMAFVDTNVDANSRALYSMDCKMAAHHKLDPNATRADLYCELAQEEQFLNAVHGEPTRGHWDGGSMATMTNHLDLLWHF